MEDASSCWPVSVEPAGFQESVAFFEKEMVINELFLLFRFHVSERIVLSCEFTLETAACLDDLLLNLVPLVFCDSWSEWEIGEVASDTDSGTADHFCVMRWERRAFQVRCIHITLVSCGKFEFVVMFEQWSEERSKFFVRIRATSVDSNA